MIPRYTREEMAQIWTDDNKFKIWLEIELLALEAMAEEGLVPKEAAKVCRLKGKFNIDRINKLEKELKHDVIAFLTSVAEFVGPESRFMHRGMTSSDVLDTAFAVQLTQSSDILLKDIDGLLKALKLRAYELKDVIQIGRSHGIHGEPITFGLKMALWYEQMKRNKERLLEARKNIAVGKISGAMGNFVHLNPSIEEAVCEKLGLAADPISTQIIQRDRHAHFFSTLAIIASCIDQIATEIRHLQRTEVFEAEEKFSKGQKGSSAMPHKRNPVLSENVSGLSRMLRSYSIAALENIPLWHERDISHSSAERMIGPDATVTLDFMLHRITGVIENLVVYPENMQRNIDRMGGLHFSQRILLELTDRGIDRDLAYRMVQRNAMKVWEQGAEFKDELKQDEDLKKYFSEEEINGFFDPQYYLRNVDAIFDRVFKN